MSLFAGISADSFTEQTAVRVFAEPANLFWVCIFVYSIQTECWKHYFASISNGVRVLLMRIKHTIPSYLTVEHSNQIKTCRRYSTSKAEMRRDYRTRTHEQNSCDRNNDQFTEADFPPMNSSQPTQSTSDETDTFIEIVARSRRALAEVEHQTKTTSTPDQTERQSTIDDEDSDDRSSSTSPYETHDGITKRRLSTKRRKVKNK